jgi:hypothetical protein
MGIMGIKGNLGRPYVYWALANRPWAFRPLHIPNAFYALLINGLMLLISFYDQICSFDLYSCLLKISNLVLVDSVPFDGSA